MSLEARVRKLEEHRVHWDQVLTGIEGTIALLLKEQIRLNKRQELFEKSVNDRFDLVSDRFDQVNAHFMKIYDRFEQIDNRLDQIDKRFDQLELLIRQCIPTN